MYKLVKTDSECVLDNGEKFHPIATLADEFGGRCQIKIDDHCYQVALIQKDGRYRNTTHIFSEAFEVLKALPSLYDSMKDEIFNSEEEVDMSKCGTMSNSERILFKNNDGVTKILTNGQLVELLGEISSKNFSVGSSEESIVAEIIRRLL